MIRVERMVKTFGDHLAVAGLDLAAEPGDILGLIGPNGAGKTTTLRILATLEEPDAGQVIVGNCDLREDIALARQRVGFMPERFGLYDELSIRDYLEIFARVLNLERRERRRRAEHLIELCDLQNKADSGCGTLSKGVRQRLYLAKTLLADPPVLLLDEPASGLDPRARIEFRELLRTLAGLQKTIVISSHILSELDAICTRVVVVEAGRARFAGALSELERELRVQRINLRLVTSTDQDRAAELLTAIQAVSRLQRHREGWNFDFLGDQEAIAALLRDLLDAKLSIYSFHVESRGLEALFLEVTKGVVS